MLHTLFSCLEAHAPASYKTLRQGYSTKLLQRDVLSGITVGIVALPLAMAFAIASGATPEQGLATSIVAGIIVAALSGSRFQIAGPTGAFVVIISGVIARQGYAGLVLAAFMAGAILIIMGLLGLGKLLKFIPYPVTTGFTTGIGVLIFTSQLKDFLGLRLTDVPAQFVDRMLACARGIHTFTPAALGLGLATLVVMILVRRFVPRIPAHFVGIVVSTVLAALMGLEVETIGSRFGALPSTLPHLNLSLSLGFNGSIASLIPDALTIAVLAGIESLLSAVVADGMTGSRHDSSTELVAMGAANIGSALFGGIPATGAIARTATNIRAGAHSPVSGMVHSLTLMAFIVACAPLASRIPLASLAAVLIVVAWDMSELHRFTRLLHAPWSDSTVMVLTTLLTVFVDLTVAVEVGIMLAAVLFMKRMSELSDIHPVNLESTTGDASIIRLGKSNVVVYDIGGPFFFGMTQRFIDVMRFTRNAPDLLILRMRQVPSIDATGVEGLETVIRRTRKRGCRRVVLTGVQPRVREVLARMGTEELIGQENIFENFDAALKVLKAEAAKPAKDRPASSTAKGLASQGA
ncbi:SulP family inorganic anion transporter [Desulfocurvus sp. DL9XJH121]